MASSSSMSSLLRGAVLVAVLFLSSVSCSRPTPNKHHNHHHPPWESFQKLSGCHLGDHRAGLAHLKQYLNRFGYLPATSPAKFSDDFDHQLESAIVAYQHAFHLNATGALDTSTVAFMATPRCGVADVVNRTGPWKLARGRTLYTYFDGKPTWPPSKRHLTYAFTSPSVVSSSSLRGLFARAFARWSAVTTLSFSEVSSSGGGADVTIGFYRGDHGDVRGFDGMGGVLAHAFAPTDGRLHIDTDEQWVVEGDVTRSISPNAMDLESVVVHEIGHILGLGHSDVNEAIMYPRIASRTRKVELANDDIAGIQSLYGSN